MNLVNFSLAAPNAFNSVFCGKLSFAVAEHRDLTTVLSHFACEIVDFKPVKLLWEAHSNASRIAPHSRGGILIKVDSSATCNQLCSSLLDVAAGQKDPLLNYILTADHGTRIAVLKNEFGAVGNYGSLVAAPKSLDSVEQLHEGVIDDFFVLESTITKYHMGVGSGELHVPKSCTDPTVIAEKSSEFGLTAPSFKMPQLRISEVGSAATSNIMIDVESCHEIHDSAAWKALWLWAPRIKYEADSFVHDSGTEPVVWVPHPAPTYVNLGLLPQWYAALEWHLLLLQLLSGIAFLIKIKEKLFNRLSKFLQMRQRLRRMKQGHTTPFETKCACLVDAIGNCSISPCLSSAVWLQPNELSVADFKGSKWLALRYGFYHLHLIHMAIKLAKQEGLLASLELASFEMVRDFRSALLELLEAGHTVLCFANEDAATELLRCEQNNDHEASVGFLSPHCQWAVVTRGPHRCIAKHGKKISSSSNMGNISNRCHWYKVFIMALIYALHVIQTALADAQVLTSFSLLDITNVSAMFETNLLLWFDALAL